jgi:myo-inositol catabolism protein IolC
MKVTKVRGGREGFFGISTRENRREAKISRTLKLPTSWFLELKVLGKDTGSSLSGWPGSMSNS